MWLLTAERHVGNAVLDHRLRGPSDGWLKPCFCQPHSQFGQTKIAMEVFLELNESGPHV